MATDQEIRDAGLLYIPKQKYLQNPYNLPVAPPPTEPVPGGITNTNAFTGGGNDGFSVYNPDPNSIANRNADFTRYNNLNEARINRAGGTYPGGFQSNEGGFEYTNSFPNNSIQMENLNNSYLNQGNTFQGERFNTNIQDEKDMIAEMAAEGIAPGDPYTYNNNRFSTIDSQNNIFDVDVRGDPALNSASKMAQGDDPYGEKTFEEEEGKKGLPGLIEKYMTNSFLGKGLGMAKDFMNNALPTNRRAMLENQLGARGVMVNDIGQIVQGDGAYDTAANVMAGYNANKMTAETFDKRLKTIDKTMGKKGYKGNLQERRDAIEAAKADFLRSQKESDFMYDETEEEKNKKKKKGSVITRFLNKKKEKKAAADAADAQAAADAKAAITTSGPSNAPGGTPGGSPDNFTLDGGMTYDNSRGDFRNSDGSNVNQDFSTTASVSNYDPSVLYAKGGRVGYFFGGRVNYKIGGRVGFKNGGLASIL